MYHGKIQLITAGDFIGRNVVWFQTLIAIGKVSLNPIKKLVRSLNRNPATFDL